MMKNQILSLAVMVIYAVTNPSITHAAYYPIKLVNNTGNTKSSIFPYVILTAQDTSSFNHQCVLRLAYDTAANAQVASLVRIGPKMHSWDYTYRVDSLQGYDPVTKSVTILIPNNISGRCMISLNYKLIMPVVKANAKGTEWVFQDPSVNNLADLNYDVIFDKFEFTYNQQNNFYIDPTAVDFFSIPISLKSSNQSSGASPDAIRSKLMKTITGVLDSAQDSAWDSLVIRNSGTIMRITAPYLAPAFSSNYLTQPGFNYIDSLVKYYQSNVLRINCDELDVAGDEIFQRYHVSPTQDPGAYLFTSSPIVNDQWIFTNSPLSSTGAPISDTINMSIANSSNFFGPGTPPFITPNKTVVSILVKNITAAFTVGLLPAPDSMVLNSSYLSNTKGHPFYGKNKQLNAPKSTGPWFNLYTRAMHKAIPQIYAFAFDDVLGQSGTLESNDNSDTITVTLGDMGAVTLPKHSNLMTVLPDSLIYNSGLVHIESSYIDTFTWKVPAGQPANARYFIMGSGPDFTIPPQQFLTYQYGSFFSAKDTIGWVTIPDSLIKNCNNLKIPMAVYSCGGPSNPCPTNDSNWTLWTKAISSNLLPLLDSAVSPVTTDSFFTLSASGNNYQSKVTWTVPPSQPSNAKYFFVVSGAGFLSPIDSMIAWQLDDSLYSSTDTAGILNLPSAAVDTNKLNSIYVAVFTCGGPGHPCPTKGNIGYWNCDEGSAPISQTPSPAVKKSKKKMRK